MGLSILEGRDFTYTDSGGASRVAILSHSLAMRLFGDTPAIGQHVRVGDTPDLHDLLVVGIAGDARVFDVRDTNLAIAYRPALQAGRQAWTKTLVVRAPTSAIRGIQGAVDGLGVETIDAMQTLDGARDRALRQERILAILGSWLALMALVLVAAGLYGLLAYILSLRRKELGIRMALGADAARTAYAIVGEGLYISGLGIVIGLCAAPSSTRLLRSVLTAAGRFEPLPILAACAILLLVTLLATVAPALCAARLEPLVELRQD
jgi:hypothetical protein